jgi:WD40 repeat protein
MTTPVTLATWDSCLGIDAVDAFPAYEDDQEKIQSDLSSQLACVGAYTLGDNGSRRGCLYVIRAELHFDSIRKSSCRGALEEVARLSEDLPGVLDVQCCSHSANTVLARNQERSDIDTFYVLAACADASLRIFALQVTGRETSNATFRFDFVRAINLRNGVVWAAGQKPACGQGVAVLALSVDSCEDLVSGSVLSSVCDSVGGLYILRISPTDIQIIHSVTNAHGAEAWTSCIRLSESQDDRPNVRVFSGGDDGTLASWELSLDRVSMESELVNSGTFRVRMAHDGVGVTAVLCPSSSERSTSCQTMFSGGYDDMLRLWDTRMMRTSVSELNVGGGIWRIKQDASRPGQLLLACMYDGFKVVKCSPDHSLSIRTAYSGHASLAYGACWLSGIRLRDREYPGSPALTGSFYDRSLQLWLVTEN